MTWWLARLLITAAGGLIIKVTRLPGDGGDFIATVARGLIIQVTRLEPSDGIL
jgi:hypothetical protein